MSERGNMYTDLDEEVGDGWTYITDGNVLLAFFILQIFGIFVCLAAGLWPLKVAL